MCVTLTTGPPLTLGSSFIVGIVVSWSDTSDISDTLSASILINSFPTGVGVTRLSSEEPGSLFSKCILFCKTTTLITAVPFHYMNQCSIINILLTPKWKLLLADLFRWKFQSHRKVFLNIPVITALLTMHLSACYTTVRDITIFRGASYTFYQKPNQPNPHFAQLI